MSTCDKKEPVTLRELFRYAEVYGATITISYDPIFPGQYVLKFSRGDSKILETTQRIDPLHRDFDELCRYTLICGCEKLNRLAVDEYMKGINQFNKGEEK